ncbi:DUF3103 family protein [Streptomyces avicenniae]|uniref:DUF3103 family protein n=1 Tax=Streptomyces avicenniae TaxID=500153 RepID=UPI00069B16F3|nr:DUF3103 family protein [Streptomyces avicenniae]
MRIGSTARRDALALVTALLVLLLTAGGAVAQPRGERAAQPADILDTVARDLARSLTDSAWSADVRRAVLSADEVDLADLAARPGAAPRLTDRLDGANAGLARVKGLTGHADSLLSLRLGDSRMRAALTRAGGSPLVAAATLDDDRAGTVTAYDSAGRAHTLDADTVPARPVYVVDIDGEEALAAGLGVLRDELTAAGLDAADVTAQAGFWSSRITSIRLEDDKEPWPKGDAEIYALVTGFGHDGKVRVDPVELPYLDEDGETYSPGQILVNWSYYKYSLADVVLMEEDGSTNYLELARAVASALLTIIDGGAYIPLVDALLNALPDDWWTDDPDYVDSWYTLAVDTVGTRVGAANNATVTLDRYWVPEL